MEHEVLSESYQIPVTVTDTIASWIHSASSQPIYSRSLLLSLYFTLIVPCPEIFDQNFVCVSHF